MSVKRSAAKSAAASGGVTVAGPTSPFLHRVKSRPGVLEKLVEWLKRYKTTDGKAINVLASDTPSTTDVAMGVVNECHNSWKKLVASGPGTTGFWLKWGAPRVGAAWGAGLTGGGA